MAKHISEICIKSYRGIKNLEIDDLSDINIIVGENNSGKTSLLEAIQILNRPSDFENIVMIARQREKFRAISLRDSPSHYVSFLNIFNKFEDELHIAFNYNSFDNNIALSLSGEVKDSLISEEQFKELKRWNTDNEQMPALDEEVKTFFGKLTLSSDSKSVVGLNKDVMINKYSSVIRSNNHKVICPLHYISPIDHITSDAFSQIISDKDVTLNVVKMLQASFDPNILDLRTIEENDGRMLRIIDHRDLDYMPISTYGDGIKKAITLANGVAMVKNGILLIDEYETAIHPKAMGQVFRFLIDACKERNIQLFLTTHSDEALEKFLESAVEKNNIRVITMYKNALNTTARVLSGEKALSTDFHECNHT